MRLYQVYMRDLSVIGAQKRLHQMRLSMTNLKDSQKK